MSYHIPLRVTHQQTRRLGSLQTDWLKQKTTDLVAAEQPGRVWFRWEDNPKTKITHEPLCSIGLFSLLWPASCAFYLSFARHLGPGKDGRSSRTLSSWEKRLCIGSKCSVCALWRPFLATNTQTASAAKSATTAAATAIPAIAPAPIAAAADDGVAADVDVLADVAFPEQFP